MKKRHEPKSASFRIEMTLDNGILKIKGLNSGIFSMGKKHKGEHFRVFPISNWTEMDVWQYILAENIAIPSLYLAHYRDVIWRNNTWLPVSEHLHVGEEETIHNKKVRFRTLGDITITGGIESEADTLEKVIMEVAAARQTERGNRADDKRSETSMEDRKKEGYF